ncbi:tail fiber assembly protein [Pseudomonas grimontii]|uniref:tail fiber assembly protein n=1 Tax=Pseudomonas grimontii TaxID=129847 RepID=UPI00387A93D2
MWYAANGVISTDPFEGAISITEDQYREALDGMSTGLELTITDGFKVARAFEPVAPPQPEPTIDELTVEALLERDQRLALAAVRIAPLQYAVDLGEATPDENLALIAWKKYSVSINRVVDQDNFPRAVLWPAAPM